MISEVETRLTELRSRNEPTDLDHIERGALFFLNCAGVEDLDKVIHYQEKDKYQVWAAETIVWTARRLREKSYREAIRGFGQLAGYKGQCGGFLPSGLSDAYATIQNTLEKAVSP